VEVYLGTAIIISIVQPSEAKQGRSEVSVQH